MAAASGWGANTSPRMRSAGAEGPARLVQRGGERGTGGGRGERDLVQEQAVMDEGAGGVCQRPLQLMRAIAGQKQAALLPGGTGFQGGRGIIQAVYA